MIVARLSLVFFVFVFVFVFCFFVQNCANIVTSYLPRVHVPLPERK